jgi:hypothetical protein
LIYLFQWLFEESALIRKGIPGGKAEQLYYYKLLQVLSGCLILLQAQ